MLSWESCWPRKTLGEGRGQSLCGLQGRRSCDSLTFHGLYLEVERSDSGRRRSWHRGRRSAPRTSSDSCSNQWSSACVWRRTGRRGASASRCAATGRRGLDRQGSGRSVVLEAARGGEPKREACGRAPHPRQVGLARCTETNPLSTDGKRRLAESLPVALGVRYKRARRVAANRQGGFGC